MYDQRFVSAVGLPCCNPELSFEDPDDGLRFGPSSSSCFFGLFGSWSCLDVGAGSSEKRFGPFGPFQSSTDEVRMYIWEPRRPGAVSGSMLSVK